MYQEMRGTVLAGGVVLAEPLDVPDGTEVVVSVIPAATPSTQMSPEEFKALPFFGMHRDGSDTRDGIEIINEARAKWAQRPYRQD